MPIKTLALLALLAPLTSCAADRAHHSSDPLAFPTFELDEAARADLFEAVSALEGNWITEDGSTTSFELTSGGSAVREILFAGQPHEMTNLYTLDGNGLNMTHYCAAGNQPHMRATAIEDSALVFHPTGVSGRTSADEIFMGAMTLTLIDEDTIEQTWTSYTGNQPGEDKMPFHYKRVD
jgi:hypothetical protein